MSEIMSRSGAWKVCPECGKAFYVGDLQHWAYKCVETIGRHGSKTRHFCTWSCYRKFSVEYEKEKLQRISNSRRGKPKKEHRMCFDCLYNTVGDDGKHFCWIGASKYVFPKKDACRKFESREEQEDGDT